MKNDYPTEVLCEAFCVSRSGFYDWLERRSKPSARAKEDVLPFYDPRESIQTFAAECLQPSDQIVMEASTNTWEVTELILPRVAKVAIANPLKVKAITEAKTKTDKVDAEVLAQLFRCDFLPGVWIPDKKTRLLREMCAHRAALVADQTRIKNRIQSFAGSETDSDCRTGPFQWMRQKLAFPS
jgi:transposase